MDEDEEVEVEEEARENNAGEHLQAELRDKVAGREHRQDIPLGNTSEN